MSIWEMISSGSGVAVILLSLIQVSKIPVNPWTWIGKKVGEIVNGAVIERLDKQEAAIKELKEEYGGIMSVCEDIRDVADEREANGCRYRILRFDDELRQSQPHTKEHFDQILADITAYENYCKSHPSYKNNVAVLAICNVKKTYIKCEEEHAFL